MGTAARPPGAISTASLARRSAPAAPAEAYSGSEPSALDERGKGNRGVGVFDHRALLEALREDTAGHPTEPTRSLACPLEWGTLGCRVMIA